MFNELLIKNTPFKKTKQIFGFMEEFHVPQSQVSLGEGKMFHFKVLRKLYRNSELNFLVTFNLILSAWKRS